MRLGPAIVLTGRGYKEHHWSVIPHQPLQLSPLYITSMPSSSRTIPGTQNQFGIGRAAVCIHGQAGNCTNAGRAITPFMFNKEGYHVSNRPDLALHKLIVF